MASRNLVLRKALLKLMMSKDSIAICLFLEMMDVLNEQLIEQDKEPVAFDHDCREGICGMCSMVINGRAHGPLKGTTTCQLHMRHFKNGRYNYYRALESKSFSCY